MMQIVSGEALERVSQLFHILDDKDARAVDILLKKCQNCSSVEVSTFYLPGSGYFQSHILDDRYLFLNRQSFIICETCCQGRICS